MTERPWIKSYGDAIPATINADATWARCTHGNTRHDELGGRGGNTMVAKSGRSPPPPSLAAALAAIGSHTSRAKGSLARPWTVVTVAKSGRSIAGRGWVSSHRHSAYGTWALG